MKTLLGPIIAVVIGVCGMLISWSKVKQEPKPPEAQGILTNVVNAWGLEAGSNINFRWLESGDVVVTTIP